MKTEKEIFEELKEFDVLALKVGKAILKFIKNNRIKLSILMIIVLFCLITIMQEKRHIQRKIDYEVLLEKKTPNKIKDMEFAYMEGQIDYMHGDIRIEKKDGDYFYVISPWNSSREPYYYKYSEYKNDRY